MLIQPIAEVVEGSLEDYEEGLKACAEASKMWMQVVYTVLCLTFLFLLLWNLRIEFQHHICCNILTCSGLLLFVIRCLLQKEVILLDRLVML